MLLRFMINLWALIGIVSGALLFVMTSAYLLVLTYDTIERLRNGRKAIFKSSESDKC